MALTLHTGGRLAGVDQLLIHEWMTTGGTLVTRDSSQLRQATMAATADRAVWGCRAGTFATLFARVRALAGLPDPERRDGLALRYAITDELEPAGAGHVVPLERLILELRAARVEPREFSERAAVIQNPPLIEAARIYAAVADIPSPDAPEWETVDHAADVVFGNVYLVGFDDYQPVEWALMEQLATCNELSAALTYVRGRRAFAARDARAINLELAADHVERHGSDPPRSGIGVIDESLFENAAPAPSTGIEWMEAAGTDVLHRLIMERVAEALHAGTPASEIAVVVPRLHEHLQGLRSVFAEASVPVQYRARMPFAASPLARALVSLFAFALEEDESRSLDMLLAWLRTPYSGADAEQIDEFERVARRGEPPLTRGAIFARWNGEAIQPAIALRGAKGLPIRSQAALLLKIGRERLARVSSSPPSTTDLLDDAAMGVLGGSISELPDDDRPTARGEVLPGRLGALLADLTFADESGRPGAVSLLDLGQSRGLRFDHVIIAGLEAGVLPSGPAVDPYLPDELRAALGFLPPRAPGTTEALLRFHAACACAGTTLTLARRFADDDGRELAPSPYWNETRRLVPTVAPIRQRGVTALVPKPSAAVTSEDLDRAFAYAHMPATPLLEAALSRRERVRGLTSGVGRDRFRVTELEGYLSCGYGWFVGGLLRPQPLEQLWDPAQEGTFGHAVLERAFSALANEGAGACTRESLPRYLEAIDAALESVEIEKRPSDAGRTFDAFVHGLRVRLHHRLDEESKRGPLYVPTQFEQKLVADWVVPGATIAGTCDRVDLSGDGRFTFVLDYKRSGRSLGDADGVYLQIPLYALMAARGLEAEPGGGAYLGVMKADIDVRAREDARPYTTCGKKWLEPAAEWEGRVETAIMQAGQAIDAIRRGDIPPPPEKECPPYCGHRLIWR